MRKIDSNQHGLANVLIIPIILLALLLFGAIGFGYWAYSGMQDYKNNSDEKVNSAVEIAKKETATQKDNEFIQREKQPLQEYNGPSSFGSISIKYPKTWSAYVDETGGSLPIDGYFHPNFVPGTDSETTFALRVQISDRTFAEEIKSFDSTIKQGKARAKPYKPVNVDNIIGSRIDGEIDNGKKGSIVLLPLRDKTIKIWTEADQFINDFDNNILKNFKYSP